MLQKYDPMSLGKEKALRPDIRDISLLQTRGYTAASNAAWNCAGTRSKGA